MRARTPLFLLAFAALSAAQTTPVTLRLGDPAPALTVAKWLKGTPQTNLADGKVHVVEFWATWCGPCVIGMPHVSDLQKKFGDDVAFVGVDASERTDDVAKAQAFVDNAHGMMAYNVAYATPRGAMSRDWMKAAGRNGIPCAFVVDKHGKIGWIGHPLMGLEEAVDLAVQDKLDRSAAGAIDKGWEAKLAQGQVALKAMDEALKNGQFDEAVRLSDKALALAPYAAPTVATARYAALAAKRPAAAHAYGESLLAEHGNAPVLLQSVASAIVAEGGDVKGVRDYALAKALAQKALECHPIGYGAASILARIAFAQGDKTGAVRLQKEAIKRIPTDESYAGDRAAADKVLAEFQGR